MNTNSPQPNAPAKILIIDDEMAMRFLLERQLTRAGFTVATAVDGPTGLQLAASFSPDLIVLDLMMPHMDGFEVCYRIRQHPALLDTPVIFLTASLTRENKLRAFAAGANDYVMKPFEQDELLAHITAVLRQRNASGRDNGRVISLFGVQERIGTTTLAIQLTEALTIQHDQAVVLLDLAGDTGAIASRLQLYSTPSLQDVLSRPSATQDAVKILARAQRHRANCWVLPAAATTPADAERLQTMLHTLMQAGFQVVIDAGARLDALALTALRQSDVTYLLAEPGADGQHALDAFHASAAGHGLDASRLRPVTSDVRQRESARDYAAGPQSRPQPIGARRLPAPWLQGISALLSPAL